MNLIDVILLFAAVTVFAIFFKQIFTGNHPKRGVDFEAKTTDDKIGGINRPDKIFKSQSTVDNKNLNRVEELFKIADESLQNGDNIEAKKALQSLLIIEPNNIDAMRMLAVAYNNMYDYSDAKETLLKLLELEPNDDLAHSILANTLHKLGEDEEAIIHHKKAIELDPNYAKHYYNHANTILDLGNIDDAIELYKKAIELEPKNEEFKKALKEAQNV